MFPKPNYKWKCKKCGQKIIDREDKDDFILTTPRKCPKCDEEMDGSPIIKGGPFPDNPFRKE